MKTFSVTKPFDKWRLDKYLTAQLDQSRSQIQKMIKADKVLVNDNIPTVHQFLNSGDQISIKEPSEEPQKKVASIRSKLSRTINKKKPTIVFKNNDYMIIEKPTGMLVHPTLRGETDTLVDWLVKKFPKLAKIGEDPIRPALVHRLDKDVSGLMIIPRTSDAFDYFKSQFKLRNIKKEYTALVHGVVKKESGNITFPIARSKEGKFVAHPVGSGVGKSAESHYEVVEKYNHFTLVKVRLITGRTNQIRIHMTAIDHPIVGDPLYSKKVKSKLSAPRIFLHSSNLSFVDPQGDQQGFHSDLPKVLQNLLVGLK